MKHFRHILTYFIWTLSISKCLATAQTPDILIYKSDTLFIYANPLEQLYKDESQRPKFFGQREGCNSTACWRGYQAKWQIIDNQLYLTEIYSCCYSDDKIKANLTELFGEKCINGIVKADWVIADILAPQGELLYYVHMGYGSLYEKELELNIKNGLLIGTKIYDNTKSKKSKYSQDNKLLFNYIYSKINWTELPKLDKKPIRIFIQFSANEKGIIDSTRIMKGYNPVFDNEAIRVVKSIPEWDIFYRHEIHERINWTLPIIFSVDTKKKYRKKD